MSMNEVGIRLKLETGEAIANANQATQAIDSLGNALQKAAIAGDSRGVIDYANALNKYKKYAGIAEDEDSQKQPTVLKVVENATKIISKAPGYIGAMGSGNSAGAALGMASDAATGARAFGLTSGLSTGAMVGLGVGAGLLGVGVAANKLSEQWEKQIPQAMELTAVMGNLTGNYKTNSIAFSRSFNLAGEAAAKFGYSVEEGMSVVGQLSKLGVSGKGLNAYNAEAEVFKFQRNTGADRESLMTAEGYAARYGLGPNALGYAYGGAKAQGLETAQYQEYLNAMLRIFEEGLSRGVIKGFGEITRTQNFIAMLGNGSPLWKGEQGLQKYQTMNQNFTSTSFESEYDVIRYKAVENVLKEAAKNNYQGVWKTYKDYGDPNKDGYLAVQRAREGGLTPEIFTETMKMLKTEVAGGSYSNLTEAVVKAFGVNYTAAEKVIEAFEKGAYKNAVASIQAPESAVSPEMTLKTATEQIKIALVNAGADVLPGKVEIMSILRGILTGVTGNKIAAGYKKEMPDALQGVYGSRSDDIVRGRAEKLLGSALKDTSPNAGPDDDKNGINNNAEAAMSIIGYLESLPEDVRRYLDASGALDSIWNGKGVNDLPKIADFLTNGQYKTKDWQKGFEDFTKKTPLTMSDVYSLTGKFGQYSPNWRKDFPATGEFEKAAIDNEPGAVGIFKEISLRVKTLESSWDQKIAKAVKDANADGAVTKKEQNNIDLLEAGKKKEVSNLIASILGPLNTLINTAQHPGTEGGNGGKEITPNEWQKMWQLVVPGVSKAGDVGEQGTVQLSRAESVEADKMQTGFSLAGSMFADALMGRFKTWAPSPTVASWKPDSVSNPYLKYSPYQGTRVETVEAGYSKPAMNPPILGENTGRYGDLEGLGSRFTGLFFAKLQGWSPMPATTIGKSNQVIDNPYLKYPPIRGMGQDGGTDNSYFKFAFQTAKLQNIRYSRTDDAVAPPEKSEGEGASKGAFWGFNGQFMDAMQESTPGYDRDGVSANDWRDFFGKLARALTDFSSSNGVAAEKIAKAADKMAEPTEMIFASAGLPLAGAGRA